MHTYILFVHPCFVIVVLVAFIHTAVVHLCTYPKMATYTSNIYLPRRVTIHKC